jgi:hypothetical protein
MSQWTLEDIEEASRINPDTFFIPTESERNDRVVGDVVRLHFVLSNPAPGDPRAERMWVEIVDIDLPGSRYQGLLMNQPEYIKNLDAGDPVDFDPGHIARVLVKEGDPRWIDCMEKGALVSEMIFQSDKTVRFAYREKPDNEKDSGWRLFAGSETDEYCNDADNIRICNVAWLMDFDPSLRDIIASGPGSVFERESRQSKWREVTDWSPPED